MTEHTLQLECISFFRNQFERHGKGVIIPVLNELASKRKDLVICLGCSDLILVMNNRVIFCELKVGYNQQQQNQKEFEKVVNRLGYEYHLIRSLNEFQNILLKEQPTF